MAKPSDSDVHALGGKLAQLLADTILNAHPHIANMAEQERAAFRADFLDGLEQHTAALIAPLLDSVTGSTTIPVEVGKLLEEVGLPTEQFTGIISQFFVFGLMFTLGQAMLAPFIQQVQNDIWSAHPDRPLSPPNIATAVVRGIGYGDSAGVTVEDWAVTEAAKSGMDPDVFRTMVGVTGMAPALQLLFEMVRRGIIEEGTLGGGGTTLVSGIQQSDIKDEWIESVARLRYVQPTPIDMVRAAVQDQWDDQVGHGSTYDEAKQWAITLGLEPADWSHGNPDWFNLLYNTAGRPPGPQEMARAANRGLTDWDSRGSGSVSFSQAISESDIKDKYIPLLKALARFYPPNGEIHTFLLRGAITEEQARTFWKDNGVPDDLIAAYLHTARVEQITQDRALAKGDILTLVQEQAMSDADALANLQQIGYTGDNAAWLIEMAHFRFQLDAFRAAVRRVSTLYVERKVTAAQATEAFKGLGMPDSQIGALVETLTHQRESAALIPSAAQIASGFYYKITDQATAMSMLEALGYDPWSAWFTLSVRVHGPLPGEPTRTVLTGTSGG